ncbi:MAG: nucleotide exchange factor GrpE [Haloarculaceae archaeon]
MSEKEGATEGAPADADGEPGGGSESDADEFEGPEPDDELVERVADASPERTAREIAALRERAASLEDELADARETVEDLESRLKRKQADFQNFKKRQEKRREREKRRATEDLVERLLDVRDNLARALDTEEGADIRSGVEKTLDQFDRVLDAEDVRRVEPEPGTETDPERHEVLMRVGSDHPEGAVADVHRPGYETPERVLRPAQVTVSDGTGGADESDEAGESTEADGAGDDDEQPSGEANADDDGSA